MPIFILREFEWFHPQLIFANEVFPFFREAAIQGKQHDMLGGHGFGGIVKQKQIVFTDLVPALEELAEPGYIPIRYDPKLIPRFGLGTAFNAGDPGRKKIETGRQVGGSIRCHQDVVNAPVQ